MIISRGRNYIFVHIPKTGGTALALALEARAMKDDILIGDTPKARRRKGRLKTLTPRGRLWKHATLADIDGVLSPPEIARMFTFTLVRNPWDRMVSYYSWLQVQSFDHPAVGLAQSRSFAAFLAEPFIQDSLRHSPARSYMQDVAGVERCELYIRLEHFEADAATLVANLGFPLVLPHANASKRPHDYRSLYDAETRARVEDFCAEDIARFGYRFDPGPSHPLEGQARGGDPGVA
ncbi:sulfotransferase family 2 domain-containing protein [Roseobacter sp. MH60115]|uniref:sulfotransferase family 2 domain-containing protein n=1 Tax=Roseobacter sp. MH60115 TaxID=2785324 RepID=UPI0018A2BC3F|nr:sulfotransferase family 2 domain-containing protein [Roseobacter sp. MH60115]